MADGRVRIWDQPYETIDPTCHVTVVQGGGGVMVRGMFSWLKLGPLVPVNRCQSATVYPSTICIPLWPHFTHFSKLGKERRLLVLALLTLDILGIDSLQIHI